MFDVRPVDQTGDLDWEKIQSIGSNVRLEEKRKEEVKRRMLFEEQQQQRFLAQAQERKEMMAKREEEARRERERNESIVREERRQLEIEKALWLEKEMAESAAKQLAQEVQPAESAPVKSVSAGKRKNKKNLRPIQTDQLVSAHSFSWRDLLSLPRFSFPFDVRKPAFSFAVAALVLSLVVGSVSYASKGFGIKGQVLGASQAGYGNLTAALTDMASRNFDGSSADFAKAYDQFSQASSQLNQMGGLLIDASHYVPFASVLSSGKDAVDAGKHISAAGQALNDVAKTAAAVKNPLGQSGQSTVSLLAMFQQTSKDVATAENELESAQTDINGINVDDLPSDKQQQFILLKEKLPAIISLLKNFTDNSGIFTDLLGGNGPRKYLFLFQNNDEMRATGGFIGSYGLLDINNGRISKFFIDGIFNPDGQLKDKIVPPAPIQKISAAWSLHDSNWFPDFPTSAREAMKFYEATGGPTVDGVITLTPAVMQKLLVVTGPIDMPDYGVTIDADNFVDQTQYQVEDGYDKTENKPKQILSDLAPLILDRIFNASDSAMIPKALEALADGLAQKDILLYSDNNDIEKLISQQGWSGEVLPADKDYMSVINTNINGFKTDGVIDESIRHSAQIQNDGSIIDTVTITRKHNGGNSQYDWYNQVNDDYMRVYVPLGSKLLDAQGQTRETDKPPLDYDVLGFKRDDLVQQEESQITIDPQTGTSIFPEAGKTVFANWVYVSPGESVTVTYKYLLPFKLFQVSDSNGPQADAYSLVAQKQSGSTGSAFSSLLSYPADYNVQWKNSDATQGTNQLSLDTKLDYDRFLGAVFEKQ